MSILLKKNFFPSEATSSDGSKQEKGKFWKISFNIFNKSERRCLGIKFSCELDLNGQGNQRDLWEIGSIEIDKKVLLGLQNELRIERALDCYKK